MKKPTKLEKERNMATNRSTKNKTNTDNNTANERVNVTVKRAVLTKDTPYIAFVIIDDEGKLRSLRLYVEDFDKQSKTWSRTSESLDLAEELWTDAGADLDFASLLANPSSSRGETLAVYIQGDSASFRKMQPRLDKVLPEYVSALRAYNRENAGNIPLSVVDNTNFLQFDLILSLEIDGEMRNFRVATLNVENEAGETTTISTKYIDPTMGDILREAQQSRLKETDEAEYNELRAETMELSQPRRKALVSRVESALGVNLDDAIEDGETITISEIVINSIPNAPNTRWLAGVVFGE